MSDVTLGCVPSFLCKSYMALENRAHVLLTLNPFKRSVFHFILLIVECVCVCVRVCEFVCQIQFIEVVLVRTLGVKR